VEVLHVRIDAVVKAGVEIKWDMDRRIDDGGADGDWSALVRLRDELFVLT
jgi:hypothetical protein